MSQDTNKEVKIPKYFLIKGDLAQLILNYLRSKPYGEVSLLIDGLKELKGVSIQEDPEGVKK